jgi:two-component system CheB/CheR fusion protein
VTLQDSRVVVRVRDSGIGIESHVLPHIFDLFKQADEVAPRSKAGLGIGLALVRSLVELHGGSVAAASAGAGQGSEPREV